MSTLEVVIIIVCGLISIFCFIYALYKDADVTGITILGILTGLISSVVIAAETGTKYPQPIDVYRGKTTLQITYQDSIPVDTTVVWKEEFNPNK